MGIIKHRNSGLAVSEVSGNNMSSELVKSEDDMVFQQKDNRENILDNPNHTAMSNTDFVISEQNSNISNSMLNDSHHQNSSMLQNFMVDKTNLGFNYNRLSVSSSSTRQQQQQFKLIQPNMDLPHQQLQKAPIYDQRASDKIDVDWTMDLPQLNITRPSHLDQKSMNDITGGISQLIKISENDNEVISDLEEDEANRVQFKFNIDDNAF